MGGDRGFSPRRAQSGLDPILNSAPEEGWILQPIGKCHRSVGFELPRNGDVGLVLCAFERRKGPPGTRYEYRYDESASLEISYGGVADRNLEQTPFSGTYR